MAEIYKVIHPVKYFNDYVSRNVRPDGRQFESVRGVILNIQSMKTADASAIVKIGNTTVICGIKLELAAPKAEEPHTGYVVTNVELPPMCSSKYRPGPPSEHAQITSNLLYDIIVNSECIDRDSLCIVPDKLVWVLYCDMVCLNNDGSILDACLIALMASLKTLTLPEVEYNLETEECVVNMENRTPLKVNGVPVATTFALYNSDVILADPSCYEEDLCGGLGANLNLCVSKGVFCGIDKLGGSRITEEMQKSALKIAQKRATLVEKIIETAIENEKNTS